MQEDFVGFVYQNKNQQNNRVYELSQQECFSFMEYNEL